MRQTSAVATLIVLLCVENTLGQSDLSKLPGYENYQRVTQMTREIASEGRVSGIVWSSAGDSMRFTRQGTQYVIRLADMSVEPYKASDDPPAKREPQANRGDRSRQRRRAGSPGRARQSEAVDSPDGKWIARYRNFNVILESVVQQPEESAGVSQDANAAEEAEAEPPAADQEEKTDEQVGKKETKEEGTKPAVVEVTTAGSKDFRYGTACWVYGEELFQSSAMWWSPDSRQLAFYEIDQRHMKDYYLTTDNTESYTQVQIERYPIAGADNPYAGLLVYDLDTTLTTRIDVGGDRLQYVYNVRFSPDGSELLFSRTNRLQNKLEVMAANPRTGETRLVVAEQHPTWQENKPLMQFLEDGKRFIWETERTLWKHYELRHLDGRQLNRLSATEAYPVESIVRVDEPANRMYYMAYSGENPNNAHLHRVHLDGTEHARLTSKPLNHTGINISPDNKWFVACSEAVDVPPTTALYNDRGEQVAVLAEADVRKAREAGMSQGELFTFKADDGSTDIYGILQKPAHFDPARKYPLVVSVYGGPSSRGIWNRFAPADAYCEFGYLLATIANRGTTGRGKAFETATYLGLGGVDLKDQVDGVKFLGQRPYVDAQRVGIYGHSYGGYMSALALVKYPDVFHVGVAGAPVTDWRNYDTIYTERYMRTPQENSDGYDNGSCLTFAKSLRGNLLVMHGLVDDNVHPSNTWQLVNLLQNENVRFDMLVYPRSKHGLGPNANLIRWEYLHRHLQPEPLPAPVE